MIWMVLLAVVTNVGVLATNYFGGSDATLHCIRPQGTSINEVPSWFINQTRSISTSNSQKYTVVNNGVQLTVHNLQYEDAGEYSCNFASSRNTSAGSIEIIGRPVFSCGSSDCTDQPLCLVRDYEVLRLDLNYMFESFGMIVGVGQAPIEFTVRNGNTIIASCAAQSEQCSTAGTSESGVSFEGDFESQLTVTISGSSLSSGYYSVRGKYRDPGSGVENHFTNSINVTVRSCQPLEDFIEGNTSVKDCVATYICPGENDNRTAMCLNTNKWEELGCQPTTATGPESMTTASDPTQASSPPPSSPPVRSTSPSETTPSADNSLLIIAVVIPVVTALLLVIAVIILVLIVLYCFFHRVKGSMSPEKVHTENSTYNPTYFEAKVYKTEFVEGGRRDVPTGSPRPDSMVSLPEDVNLPEKGISDTKTV